MASSNNHELISRASLHTQKKFELIEKYISSWAQKLMNNSACQGLVFIDCMCNSGVYHDDTSCEVEGTPIRVARILKDVAFQYPDKRIYLFFNDLSKDKTDLLKSRLPKESRNLSIEVTNLDANDLLKQIGGHLNQPNLHYFLLYDPYDASIDWEALLPFFRYWGEVMINHMVSDPVRAITQVKKNTKKEKYEGTYLTEFENLVPFGSNKEAYEERIRQIIAALTSDRKYYVAAYPFFNTQNSQVYSLIHCTSNAVGFELYKKTAWQTFGDKSSNKKTRGNENQLMIDFNEPGAIATTTDDTCFYVKDIAKYVQGHYAGQENVLLDDIWGLLAKHPVFPSEGYRNEIKAELKNGFGASITIGTNMRTGKRATFITFKKGTGLA